MPPDEMFRHIRGPVLALAGEKDRNVSPEDAAAIARIVREAGGTDATAVLVPDADHSFQIVPADPDEQVRERFTFQSFRRPYHPRVYAEMLLWLHRRFPTPADTRIEALERIAARPSLASRGADAASPVATTRPAATRGQAGVEVEGVSEHRAERVYLAPGIEIIPDITNRVHTAGVQTLEGRIGPLILTESGQTHFIDMPAGMYVEEHPHGTGSVIYTVRGRWVLCSAGRRHLMEPGSLFRFAPNTPTGYEVPFAEDAYILIFKDERVSKSEMEFIDYLKGLAADLEGRNASGVPFRLRELPREHPARVFAREVNPGYEAGLAPAASQSP
jgi:quercetin dioxygenase-like cupin family protein